MKNKIKKRIIKIAPILVSGLVLILALAIKLPIGKTTMFTASTLKKIVNISELSTAQYKYKGVAIKYKDKEKDNVKCRIYYEAIVKVGVNMEEIEFEINEEKKSVTPILPEFLITDCEVDEESFDFMHNTKKLNIKEIIELCEEDATTETEESGALYEAAEENLKASIEALLYPILENEGYHIEWIK